MNYTSGSSAGVAEIASIPSLQTEVATLPQLFLTDSSRLPLSEHQGRVEAFSDALKGFGLKAVIGGLTDYVQLVENRFKTRTEQMFGPGDNRYTSTITQTSDAVNRYIVGCYDSDSGISVQEWPSDAGADFLWVAPLIVPAT